MSLSTSSWQQSHTFTHTFLSFLLTCLCFGSFEQMTYKRPLRLTTEHPSQNFLTELRTFIPRVCSCDIRERAAGFASAAVPAVAAAKEVACDEGRGRCRDVCECECEWGEEQLQDGFARDGRRGVAERGVLIRRDVLACGVIVAGASCARRRG